ncbi:hypothetical protein OSB04_002627 [Centaurea solstitialis]|uniref:Major facilitator superfamily (MFS) profile domain-containing protein n=1 Tax=Centaurea solstitialis TaxID=347529 RepID=A0AA38WVE0_9ASTR|nr:hypothetical protein OSB04_002627 [Centaurea solstitialis]
MEGGVVKANKTEFSECFRTIWSTPYIMLLALSAAGIGGLLFGVISGASLYIRDDFEAVEKHTWLQHGGSWAIVGAAFGGWMNDKFGRKKSIFLQIFVHHWVTSHGPLAPNPWVIIIGRFFVGLGVGIVSMTSPLYISEASPARIRGALVSNPKVYPLTGGQFLSYLINLAFAKTRGKLALDAWELPSSHPCAIYLDVFSPEFSRWLYRQVTRHNATF